MQQSFTEEKVYQSIFSFRNAVKSWRSSFCNNYGKTKHASYK